MPGESDYLPYNWNKPEVRGMFSVLKPRDVDPVQYDRIVKFWSDIIANYCKYKKSAVVNFVELKSKLRNGNLVPTPLEGVLEELYRRGMLRTSDSVLKGQQGWMSWGMSMLLGSSKVDVKSETNVHMETVKHLAAGLLTLQKDLANEIVDYPEVIAFEDLRADAKAKSVISDDVSFELAVNQLIKDGHVSQGVSKSGDRVLKFKDGNGPAAFTATDASVHEIRRALRKIEADLKILESKEAELKENAKNAIRQKNKQQATNILRKKKRIEKEIESKDGQYRQLLGMLEKIAQTRQTKEVMDAYRIGNEAFKDALNRQGLTVDKVDETIDSVQGIMDDFKEIDDALAHGFKISGQEGLEDELEAELNSMIEEDKIADRNNSVRVNQNVINISNLPEVPSDEIRTSNKRPAPASDFNDLEQRMKRLREMA